MRLLVRVDDLCSNEHQAARFRERRCRIGVEGEPAFHVEHKDLAYVAWHHGARGPWSGKAEKRGDCRTGVDSGARGSFAHPRFVCTPSDVFAKERAELRSREEPRFHAKHRDLACSSAWHSRSV